MENKELTDEEVNAIIEKETGRSTPDNMLYIPKPKFDLHQKVWLINEQDYTYGTVYGRSYVLDKEGNWSYTVMLNMLHSTRIPEDMLTAEEPIDLDFKRDIEL